MEDTAQNVGVRELLEAGVHFGHQAKRWNPKMKRYIFAERAGVHIIDLDQTIKLLRQSSEFVRSVAEAGRDVLFVGTKKQAQLTIAEQAMRCGQPYVAERYIGGMLTNFRTIRPRIEYFVDLARRVEETPEEERTGRDWFALTREYEKLRRNFAGITNMERLPGAVFIVDPNREELLVREANRLRIPVISLTDTNCDPDHIDYVIPGNDDAIRAINLISRIIADAVLSGKGEVEVQPEERPVPPAVEEARASAETGTMEEAAESAKAHAEEASAEIAEAEAEAESEATETPEPETVATETTDTVEPEEVETLAEEIGTPETREETEDNKESKES